jgi:hypothetical protein
MMATIAAEGHTPSVIWKPGMRPSGATVRNSTRTGRKGEEIAGYTCRIYEAMAIVTADAEKAIRVCYQQPTDRALVGFGAVAAHSPI